MLLVSVRTKLLEKTLLLLSLESNTAFTVNCKHFEPQNRWQQEIVIGSETAWTMDALRLA